MPLLNYTTYFNDTEVANHAHPEGDRFDGWVITSELWESLGQGLVLPINPERLSISQPLRSHEYEAYFGKTASQGFNRKKQTYFDVFNLQLTFNSGYIIPKWSTEALKTATAADLRTRWPKKSQAQTISTAYPLANEKRQLEFYNSLNSSSSGRYIDPKSFDVGTGLYDSYIPPGTQNLYALLSLYDGPKTWRPDLKYSDAFGLTAPNRIKVYANSLAFPSMTFFCLALDQGVSWSESAEDPTSFNVTINLLCTMTDPELGRASMNGLLVSYKQNFNLGTLSRLSMAQRS